MTDYKQKQPPEFTFTGGIEYPRDFAPSSGIMFDTYQVQAARTMKAQERRDAMLEAALGLIDEAGEVVGPIKKWAFHGHGLDTVKIAEELGDVLWYLASMTTTLGLSLEDIATGNISKLMLRYPDGFSGERSHERDDAMADTAGVYDEQKPPLFDENSHARIDALADRDGWEFNGYGYVKSSSGNEPDGNSHTYADDLLRHYDGDNV